MARNNSINALKRMLHKYPPLTKEEEIKLAVIQHDANSSDTEVIDAQHRIVMHNGRFIFKRIYTYTNNHDNVPNIFSDVIIFLMGVVKYYKPESNVRFMSYIGPQMNRKINEIIYEPSINLPTQTRVVQSEAIKFIIKYEQTHDGTAPSMAKIKEHTSKFYNISDELLKLLIETNYKTISGDVLLQQDETRDTLFDMTVSEQTEVIDTDGLINIVKVVLKKERYWGSYLKYFGIIKDTDGQPYPVFTIVEEYGGTHDTFRTRILQWTNKINKYVKENNLSLDGYISYIP